MKSYGENYTPIFHDLPSDLKSRWELVREFIRGWYKFELQHSIQEATSSTSNTEFFGHSLPFSVKEWIYLAQELEQKGRFGIFRDTFLVREIEEISALSLLVQAEGDLYFVVRSEYLETEDPPVDVYYFNEQDASFTYYERNAERVTNFALSHLIYYSYGKGGGFGVDITITAKFIQDMKDSFETFIHLDHLTIFERQNMIAFFSPSHLPEKSHFRFEIWKELPKADIPLCIWEIDRSSGGSFHGMMIPQKRK